VDVETATTHRFFSGEKGTSGTMQNNTSVGVVLGGTTNPGSGNATMLFNITYEILDY
jgi:hypothetical protein